MIRHLSLLVILLWVTIAQAQPPSAPGTPRIPADTANRKALTVTVTGNGTVSGPGLSSCAAASGDCTENIIVNTTTTIFATPTSGSTFSGWGGACSGTGTCTILMNQAQTVTATFSSSLTTLTVTKIGTGNGTVASAGGTVNCGTQCVILNNPTDSFTLTATADPGSSFMGWSGDCSGTGTCFVLMSTDKNVTANFSGTVVAFDRYARPNGLIAGSCTNNGTGTNGACRMDYALTVVQAGETLGLLDGTYTGSTANMLNLTTHVPGKNGSSGAPITVMAVNDGQVVIDGEFTREPFKIRSHSYWTFQGFDVVNSSNSVMHIGDGGPLNDPPIPNPSNLIFRRIVASNSNISPRGTGPFNRNDHVWQGWTPVDSLFEDIVGFGTGRNTWVHGIYNTGSGNTIRRAFFRHEGYPYQYTGYNPAQGNPGEICGGGFQPGYHDAWPYTGTMEDIIVGDTYEQVLPSDTACYNPGGEPIGQGYGYSQTYGSWMSVVRGVIVYNRTPGPTAPQGFGDSIMNYENQVLDTTPSYSFRDIFVDGRNYPLIYGPFWVRNKTSGPPRTFDRITSLRNSGGNASSWDSGQPSTFTECTATGNCPNFYTGVAQGTGTAVGARNCFEYVNGTLTQTPKWPWRMDNRIKAALARARAAGTGGSLLAGTGSTGYAANTVTSEIASRYGAIPPGCFDSTR